MRKAVVLVLFLMACLVQGQSEDLPLLISPSGEHIPLTSFELNHYYGEPGPSGIATSAFNSVLIDVGGIRQTVPLSSLLRLDLERPGERTRWLITTTDGRVLPLFSANSQGQYDADTIRLAGTNEFGGRIELESSAFDPRKQGFTGIIFKPAMVSLRLAPTRNADVLTLKNGDVLSGTVLTEEFTIQASYGMLQFPSQDLSSIRVVNDGDSTMRVVLKMGDQVSGFLQNAELRFRLTNGTELAFQCEDIASIEFASSGD